MLFILLSILLAPLPDETELVFVRNQFHLAVYEEKEAIALDGLLKGIPNKTALLTGFQGANEMLLAKYAGFPMDKFRKFSHGKELLEKAIQQDPKNVELKYLRYSIQSHCPAFLKYNQNLNTDRNTLIQSAASIPDRDLRKRILTLLLSEPNLTAAERKLLQ